MTWRRSCVKETPVRTRATRRRAKCVTIIEYPSLSPPRRHRPCTFASSAPTRFTDLIPIKCSTIFCTLCNKCRWYARTRWVEGSSNFIFRRSFNLDFFFFFSLFNSNDDSRIDATIRTAIIIFIHSWIFLNIASGIDSTSSLRIIL